MNGLSNHILSVVLVTPLLGAGAVLLLRRRPAAVRLTATFFAAAAFAAAVPLWFRYEPHGKTWQFAERLPWIPPVGASYYVGVDGVSILLILLTTVICALALLASWDEIDGSLPEFYAAMLVLEAGLVGAFMSLDFLLFFVCWVLVASSAWWLAGRSNENPSPRSRLTLTVHASFAGVALLAGILTLYFDNYRRTQSYSFDVTLLHTGTVPADVQVWVFAAFVVAFGVLAALVPFHVWLTRALSDVPPVVSAVFAAAVVKVGTYGFVRFILPIVPDATSRFAWWVAALAAVGLVYGALRALVQRDWKRAVACGTVSYLSLVMLGATAPDPAALTGSLVQQISHGVFAAGFFLLGGMIERRARGGRLDHIGGLWRTAPVLAAAFLALALFAAGLAMVNPSSGEMLMVRGAHGVSKWLAGVLVLGFVLGAAYLARLYVRTMVLPGPGAGPSRSGDVTMREAAVVVPLVVLAAWFVIHPAALLLRLETSVGRVVARVNPALAPYVAQGSDCPTAAPPDPGGPPPIFVLVEPCADGSADSKKPGSSPSGEVR